MSHVAPNTALDNKKMPWMTLLDEALNAPGTLSKAYQLFHHYSLCNQMFAYAQLLPDKLGPIATFKRWQEQGRTVRKGEKAIALYMPFVIRDKETEEGPKAPSGQQTGDAGKKRMGFMLRRNWFSLAQTDGVQEPVMASPPEWSMERALNALRVTRVPFAHIDGNAQGYAIINGDRELAISPLCDHPMRTLFHELAHLDLHAEGDPLSPHAETPPKDVREVEAEAVSYLVADALGVEMEPQFIDSSRAYIQGWMQDAVARADFARTRASRVFGCAQRLIVAGRPEKTANTP